MPRSKGIVNDGSKCKHDFNDDNDELLCRCIRLLLTGTAISVAGNSNSNSNSNSNKSTTTTCCDPRVSRIQGREELRGRRQLQHQRQQQ